MVRQRQRVASGNGSQGRCMQHKDLGIKSLQTRYYLNVIMSSLDAPLVHVSQVLLSAQQHFLGVPSVNLVHY